MALVSLTSIMHLYRLSMSNGLHLYCMTGWLAGLEHPVASVMVQHYVLAQQAFYLLLNAQLYIV